MSFRISMASLDDVDADLLETEEAIQRIEDVHNRRFPKRNPQNGGFFGPFFFLWGKNIKNPMGFWGFGFYIDSFFFWSFESNASVESSEFLVNLSELDLTSMVLKDSVMVTPMFWGWTVSISKQVGS